MGDLQIKEYPSHDIFRQVGLNKTLQEKVSVWCLSRGIDFKVFVRVAIAHFFFVLVQKPGDESRLFLEYLQSFSGSTKSEERIGL